MSFKEAPKVAAKRKSGPVSDADKAKTDKDQDELDKEFLRLSFKQINNEDVAKARAKRAAIEAREAAIAKAEAKDAEIQKRNAEK
jgi:hypothetical protein